MSDSTKNTPKSTHDTTARRDSNRDRLDENDSRFAHWLKHGSPRLEDAWVSLCSHSQTNIVKHILLVEVVEAIRTGGPITVPKNSCSTNIDLAENQERVRHFYNSGCSAAEILNWGNIQKLLREMSITAEPEEVEVVSRQPSANENRFFIEALRLRGDNHPVNHPVVYHPPYVMGKERATEVKKWTPAVTFAGLFLGKRDGTCLARATQLFPIDLDTVDNLAAVKTRLREDAQIPLVFTSISGSGLRACAWGPVASDAADYRRLYALVARAICKRHGLETEIDEAASDLARLCYLPFDTEAALLTTKRPFTIEDLEMDTHGTKDAQGDTATPKTASLKTANPKPASPKKTTKSAPRVAANDSEPKRDEHSNNENGDGEVNRDLLAELLKYIPADEYDVWLRVNGALKLWGEEAGLEEGAFALADEWSKSCPAKYDATAHETLWKSLKRGNGERRATVGTLFYLAKQHGWKPPARSGRKQTEMCPAANSGDPNDDWIILPSGSVTISDCARNVFERSTELYWHGAVCELGVTGLEVVKPDAFRTRVERYGKLAAWRAGRGGSNVLQPSKMSADDAKAILASLEARELLPPVANVLHCPVITEHEGKIIVLSKGYHRVLGGLLILEGEEPETLTLKEARKVLLWTVEELAFQTPADKSRVLASRITPALKLGGWLRGSTPLEVMEANEQQAGKGWSHQISSAIYNTKACLVVQRKGGVGSWDESFGAAVATGSPFIGLDNVRGRLNSEYLEGFITAPGLYEVRLPGRGQIWIDPRRHVLQLTSNGMESTLDLALRSNICRIRKQQGKILSDAPALIRQDTALLMAAVFTLIREWHKRGKPLTNEKRHDFHEWAQSLDWIVQNLLDQAPLMDGHREAQSRVSSPEMTWLRAVGNALESTGRLDLALTASGLAEACQSHAVEIPGIGGVKDVDAAARVIGGLMRRLFGGRDQLSIEGFKVTRTVKEYRKKSGDRDSTPAYLFEVL